MPIWRKAPLALLRFPGLLASIVLGSMLVALVAGAYPLFVSRSEGELLRAEIAEPTVGRFGAGLFYGVTQVGLRERARGGLLRDRLDEEFTWIAANGPQLGSPVRFVLGATASVTGVDGQEPASGPVSGVIFSGTNADQHVRIVSGAAEAGALIPDLIAEPLGVEAGDTIVLDGQVEISVAGVYEALYTQPVSSYWSPWSEQIFPPRCLVGVPCLTPPGFILVGQKEALDLTRAVGDHDVDLGWVAPVVGLPLNADEARAVRGYADHTYARVSDGKTKLGKLFACCGSGHRFLAGILGDRTTEFRSAMPSVLHQMERRAAGVEGPLRLLLIAALGVAGAVVAAAAAFAVAGRRTEAALLHARGWGPTTFALRATLESVLPVTAGVAVGLAAGWALVSWFGPAAPAADARTTSITWAAAAGAASLLLLGVVSAASFSRTFEMRASGRRLQWIPWELLVVAAAMWVLFRLRADGALVEDPVLDVQRPSPLLLAFPVLLVAGLAMLAARIVVALLRRAGPNLGAGSAARYLASRRLTALPGLTVLLIGAVSLCLGIFVNAHAMIHSLRTTVDAKAGVFVGSDVQVLVDFEAPTQERFPLPITRSTRLKYAGQLVPGDLPFDILGVDARTLADAAFWDASFSDLSLEELAARLVSDSGRLPVVLVRGNKEPDAIRTAQTEIPVRVVGHANAFPGASSDDPVVVVDVASLEHRVGPRGNPFLSANARTEYWIAGETDEALAAVDELEAYPLGTLTLEGVKDIPSIDAAIKTFSMLSILALAAVSLAAGVLVVYLQSRERARAISSVLSRRMGMRERESTAALAMELGATLAASFAIGGSLGLLAADVVSPLLDPLPRVPPSPLFDVPWALVPWTLAALAGVTALGAWVIERRASAVNLGEVLRVAE